MRTFDGLELDVQVAGRADADLTVVLAHCWTSDQDSWRYQVRDLRRVFGEEVRVVTYDHRGHGRSEATPEPAATIENLGRDLGDVIDSYAPGGDLVLAGHSIGGMTLMALAEQRPRLFAERVVGVVFVSTSGGGLADVTLGLPPAMGRRVKERIPRMLAARARRLSRRQRRRAPALESLVVRRFLFGTPMRLRDHALTVDGLVNTPAASMCGFYTDLMHHDRLEGLHALDGVPVHVLVGSQDRLTPPRHARRLAEAVPGAELTVAEGAGHMLPLERDELVSQVLVTLVEKARANRA